MTHTGERRKPFEDILLADLEMFAHPAPSLARIPLDDRFIQFRMKPMFTLPRLGNKLSQHCTLLKERNERIDHTDEQRIVSSLCNGEMKVRTVPERGLIRLRVALHSAKDSFQFGQVLRGRAFSGQSDGFHFKGFSDFDGVQQSFALEKKK